MFNVFKRILLVLALICMIVFPVFSQTGNYTTHNLFYLPEYGAYGITEYNEYNAYMEIADAQIWANKLTFDNFKVSNINDVDLTDIANSKILKYNSTSEKWECEDESGGGATEFIGLTDTPANYTGQAGKYVKVNAGETDLEFGTPIGAGDMSKSTYDTDEDGIVDKSETVDDGVGNSSTAADVKDAVGKKHSQNTDTAAGGEWNFGAHSAGFTLQSATGDGTTTIDWRLGNKFQFTFGAQNDIFTFTAPTNPCTLMLTIIQDGTGSRTITWPATVKWAGGVEPTLTTTADARDKVALDWDGTQYDGMASLDFK